MTGHKEPLKPLSFPHGPLTIYRNKRTFDVRRLQELLITRDLLFYKEKVFETLEKDKLFQHTRDTLPLQEQRRLAALRANRLKDYGFCSNESVKANVPRFMYTLGIYSLFDQSMMVRYVIPFHFFEASVLSSGSEKHNKVLEKIAADDIRGCFALTEVAHGTNAKKLKTTAHFDPLTQEFVLHTSDFEAAKCWVGNLGSSSTHATVFAQLYTPDGVCHGLHGFLTPLRNPDTMLPYPGVFIGDMGEKLGLNGIDNGFAMFNNYRIHKDSLLDRHGTVSDSGAYESPFSDPRRRFGALLGALIGGRICVTSMSVGNLTKAISIAIRYSCSRRQFGPKDDGEELPVIEYQLQKWRLLPHLAAAYALEILTVAGAEIFGNFRTLASDNEKLLELVEYLTEIHGVWSAAKPLASWAAQTCIQESREACGGHGYLAASGFGVLRNDNDANCTYEGDNNVLMQQTSNWLLSLWRRRSQPFASPLGSVKFLYESRSSVPILSSSPSLTDIVLLYEWLICWLLDETEKTYQNNIRRGEDIFTAKNNCQVFCAHTLSLAYAEHFVLQLGLDKIKKAQSVHSAELRVLNRLLTLYGLSRLQTHIGDLYESGLAQGLKLAKNIKIAILRLCDEILPDAVSLVDAIAPPDFFLNSAIGTADGQIYKNLEEVFTQSGISERPYWWRELTSRFRSRL